MIEFFIFERFCSVFYLDAFPCVRGWLHLQLDWKILGVG